MSKKLFAKKHGKIRKNIIQLARQHPTVLSDYRKLVQYYWHYIDGLPIFIPLEVLEKLTNPESIGRAFRKAVELGELEVPEGVGGARGDEERKYRGYYGRQG